MPKPTIERYITASDKDSNNTQIICGRKYDTERLQPDDNADFLYAGDMEKLTLSRSYIAQRQIIEPQNSMHRTISGNIIAYKSAEPIKRYEMTFKLISNQLKGWLERFHEKLSEGIMQLRFTDIDSQSILAHWTSDLTWERSINDLWSLRIRLEA